MENCTECDSCGEVSHYKGEKRHGFCLQINAGGRVMAVRKAAWMAFYPDRKVVKGLRITSKCENPNCVNPELLTQVKPGTLLAKHYTDGLRSKSEAAAHLIRYVTEKQKLTEADAQAIRLDDRKGAEAAHEYGISKEHWNAIQRGDARVRKAGNPFAGIGARE